MKLHDKSQNIAELEGATEPLSSTLTRWNQSRPD